MVREERWASHNVFSREKGWSQMRECLEEMNLESEQIKAYRLTLT